jgi:hypothetical protein
MKMNLSPGSMHGRACAPGNVDSEIDHLERVLAAEGADSMFGRTYWRARVMDLRAMPGLVPRQRERLERLLSRIADDADSTG